MPLIQEKSKGKFGLGDGAWTMFHLLLGVIIIVAWYSWNMVWSKGFALALTISGSYMMFRIVYYCICEYSFIYNKKVKGKKYSNNRLAWPEWREGLVLLPWRTTGLVLFLVSSLTLLISKNGQVTMLAGMLATSILAVAYGNYYVQLTKGKTPREIANDPKALKSWLADRRRARDARQSTARYWIGYFTVLLAVEYALFMATTTNPPLNDTMKGLLFINLWPGLGMVALGLGIFIITGRGFVYAVPFAMIPLLYGAEYLFGYQLLPPGHLDSGFDRIFLPLLLWLTILLETAGPIRRTFFKTSPEWAPIMEQLARDINFS